MTWAPADECLDRWREIYLAVARGNGAEPDAGRHLLGWTQQAGLAPVTYTPSTWTFATAEERAWWTDLWAERVVASSLAEQAVAAGIATTAELADVSAGWRAWGTRHDAVFIVLHGEIVCPIP